MPTSLGQGASEYLQKVEHNLRQVFASLDYGVEWASVQMETAVSVLKHLTLIALMRLGVSKIGGSAASLTDCMKGVHLCGSFSKWVSDLFCMVFRACLPHAKT